MRKKTQWPPLTDGLKACQLTVTVTAVGRVAVETVCNKNTRVIKHPSDCSISTHLVNRQKYTRKIFILQLTNC